MFKKSHQHIRTITELKVSLKPKAMTSASLGFSTRWEHFQHNQDNEVGFFSLYSWMFLWGFGHMGILFRFWEVWGFFLIVSQKITISK